MNISSAKRAALALIIANIIWGAAPPIFKWSLLNIPMYTLAFSRFVIPALIIFLFVDKKKLAVKRHDFKKLFYMAYCLISVNILFLFLGVERTVSINASAIAAAGPVFLMIGSLFMLKEKVSHYVVVGNLIGFLGVFLIIVQPLLREQKPEFFWGNIFLVISTISVVMGTILAKEIIKSYHPITLTFWSFTIGAVTILPLFIMEIIHSGFLSHITIQGIVGIVYGGFFSSLTAYFFYFWSLKYFPATTVGVFTYIDPVTTIVFASLLLHESITPIYLLGGFLIFFGIYLSEKRIHYHPIHFLFQNTDEHQL